MYIIIIFIIYLQNESNTFFDFINDDSVNILKIYKLEKQVKTLENNIKEMEIKIKEKDKIISEEKTKNERLNKINQELQNNLNNDVQGNKILELENEIKLIKEYFLLPEEKLISLKISSVDQNINFSTIAKINDKFTKIENILYDKYPAYKETENYFLVNGIKINRHKTLEENKIKNNDVLTLNIIEDE